MRLGLPDFGLPAVVELELVVVEVVEVVEVVLASAAGVPVFVEFDALEPQAETVRAASNAAITVACFTTFRLVVGAG